MAKCSIKNGVIASISGRLGDLLYKTYRKPDGTTVTRSYLYRKHERSTPLSPNEVRARIAFANAAAYFRNLNPEQLQSYREQYTKARFTFNGKRYATLRGYITARFLKQGQEQG